MEIQKRESEKMISGLVSIVIPVYNVEAYLDRCVQSVVNQTYKNLEIILVDDGSPDKCPAMCDAWAQKDSRIKVVHKENAGLGYARNTGIENATGEYIYFVDSDDYIRADLVELAYGVAREDKAEVVVFGMSRVNQDGKEIASVIPETEQRIFCGEEVQLRFLPGLLDRDPITRKNMLIPSSACSMFINMSVVKESHWRFVSERDVISEDIYSLLVLFKGIARVAVLKEALYCYCVNPVSLTRVYRADRYEKNRYFYHACLLLCDEMGYPAEVKRACAGPLRRGTIDAMKQAVAYSDSLKEAKNRIRMMVDDSVLQQVLRESLGNQEIIKARILFWAIRRKWYTVCYIILKAHNATTRNR